MTRMVSSMRVSDNQSYCINHHADVIECKLQFIHSKLERFELDVDGRGVELRGGVDIEERTKRVEAVEPILKKEPGTKRDIEHEASEDGNLPPDLVVIEDPDVRGARRPHVDTGLDAGVKSEVLIIDDLVIRAVDLLCHRPGDLLLHVF